MQRAKLLVSERRPRVAWWLERLAALLAFGCVFAVSIAGSHIRTAQDSSSDFKTVYASGKCFLNGSPAYDFDCLSRVFHSQGIAMPAQWYAHAPIYPPFTFGVLALLITLPMVTASYVWMVLSALAMLCALWAALGYSDRHMALGPTWRLLLIILVAANPLVSFALQVGNLSVVAAALCIIAIMSTDVLPRPVLGLLLALSLLLKPHIGLCLLVGMVVSRDRVDRAVALRALAYFAAAASLFALAFSIHHHLGLQLHGYVAMVAGEVTSGSMNPHNHQLLPIEAEITSFWSLIGYFGANSPTEVLGWACCASMAVLLFAASRATESDQPERRIALLGAWSAFGMLLMYHRAHDAILLLFLVPWMLGRLRHRWMDLTAWGSLLLLLAASVSLPWLDVLAVSSLRPLVGLVEFLRFRQAPFALFLLMLVLLKHLVMREEKARAARPNAARDPSRPILAGVFRS